MTAAPTAPVPIALIRAARGRLLTALRVLLEAVPRRTEMTAERREVLARIRHERRQTALREARTVTAYHLHSPHR